MKQPAEHNGPHNLPHSEQERCAVEGRRIDGSSPCTVIAIRDRKRHGRVVNPHGDAGLGALVAYNNAAHTPRRPQRQPVMTLSSTRPVWTVEATGTESAASPDPL